MRRTVKVILLVLAATTLFGISVYAAGPHQGDSVNAVNKPSITVDNNTANCTASVVMFGSTISATLELYQGDTLVDSWQKTGTGMVVFSENATIVRGLTYTLTISGTINGIDFTPQSTTRTLW